MPLDLPVREPCPFCNNIAGVPSPTSGPCAVVERTDLTFTFVAPRLAYDCHVLVIPIRHTPTILELNDDEAAAIAHATRRAARAIQAAFDPDGINLWQNNGLGSGQSVPHYHQHVVTRTLSAAWPPLRPTEYAPNADREAIAERLRAVASAHP